MDDSGPLRVASVTEALWWLPEPDVGDPPSAVPPDNPDAGRILVVDDHADMRAYLVRLLGRTHRVDAVTDGAAALVAALADPPDLVLADVSLPGLSGLDLLTALRGDPRTSLVPVVLMSARAGPEAAVEGLGAGADDYLVTPFSARELRARVDGRVALGRARREAERRFRAMADSTPTLIWADGPGGQRLFVNRGWLEFTGAEPDADLGLAWQDRIHPADRSHYGRVRAAADGGPFEVEYRLRAANGHYRWVLDRGAPAEGYVGGYVGGCLDIDSRVGERERQRLLAVIGAALDRETTVTGRRQTLVRTLVDEGLADMARFVEISDGQATDGLAIAAHTPEQEAALRGLDVDWMQVGRTVTAGEVRQYDVDEAFILASSTDERQRELRRSMRFGTVALVPLSARGQTSGLLAVARTRDSTPFDDGDTALLADLAERAATALDNALLLEREQANRARLEVLQRATAALSAAATPEQVAAAAVAAVRRPGARDRGHAVAADGCRRGRGARARRTPGLGPRPADRGRRAGTPRRGGPHPRPGVGRGRRSRRRRLHPAGRRRHVRRRRRARRAAARRAHRRRPRRADGAGEAVRAGAAARRAARRGERRTADGRGVRRGRRGAVRRDPARRRRRGRPGPHRAAGRELRRGPAARRGAPRRAGRPRHGRGPGDGPPAAAGLPSPRGARGPHRRAPVGGRRVGRPRTGRRHARRRAARARRPDPPHRRDRAAVRRRAADLLRAGTRRGADAGRAVRPGAGPGAAAPGRARRGGRPAAQPAPPGAAAAAPAPGRRPLPAQRRRYRRRRRLVRPAADRREPGRGRRRRRRRARGDRRRGDGPAAQRAGGLPARRPLPRRRVGAARPVRPPGPGVGRQHLRLPRGRLRDRRAVLGQRRASAGAAARTRRPALPRGGRRDGARGRGPPALPAGRGGDRAGQLGAALHRRARRAARGGPRRGPGAAGPGGRRGSATFPPTSW